MKQGTTWLGLACLMALVVLIGASVAAADTLMMPARQAFTAATVERTSPTIVVWGNTTQPNGTPYTLDFGDSTSVSGTVADRSFISAPHTYTSPGAVTAMLSVGAGCPGAPCETATATITVLDPSSLSAFDRRAVAINQAIEDGLRYLYTTQDNRAGNFAGNTTSWSLFLGDPDYYLSMTSLVVLAFQNHGYGVTNNNAAPSGIYQVYVVQRGLNFIFDNLSKVTLGTQVEGPPGTFGGSDPAVTNDPCVGVPADADKCTGLGRPPVSTHSMYASAVIALAVAGSGAPTGTVDAALGAANAGFVAGRTYAEVLQRQANTIVWGMNDGGNRYQDANQICQGFSGSFADDERCRGGFGYNHNSQAFGQYSDGSTAGWAILALLDAAAAGAAIPSFVANEVQFYLANAGNSDGSLKYQVYYGDNQSNFPKTGIGLQVKKFAGIAIGNSSVQNALTLLSNNWSTGFSTDGFSGANKGLAYGMFNAFKGLKLYGVQTLPGVARAAGPGSIPANDWYEDYRDWLVANQVTPSTDGSWTFGWSCCFYDVNGATAVAELILSPTALVLPSNITLTPATATNPVGTSHTVTATVISAGGAPIPGVTVTFTITSGPNAPLTGTAVTDANGQASFTYPSNGVPGTDTIQASVGTLTSNTVTKTWVEEPTPGGQGRMTGGGSVFTASGMRVTHGFELHCDASKTPNNLQVNWGKGNRFHLASLTSASCSDAPAITPNPPAAGFDTYVGEGTGSYNGQPGATVKFKLTDAGEPGKNDTAEIEVKVGSTTVLSVSGKLNSGNQQAHKD